MSNKQLVDLIKSKRQTKTFELDVHLNDSSLKKINCQYLSLKQYQQLVETIVDNAVTQVSFYQAVNNIISDCVPTEAASSFTVIDRILFILKSRISCISSSHQGLDLNTAYQNIIKWLETHSENITPKELKHDDITLKYGVITLNAENRLNNEVYLKEGFSVDTEEQLRNALGKTFINEVVKSIYSIQIGEFEANMTDLSFNERLEICENLPVPMLQEVITYIENYKLPLNECLEVNGTSLSIDGSLFSVRA